MAVGLLKGVTKIDGDPKKKRVAVQYDPSMVNVDAIQERIAEIGYAGVKEVLPDH